MKSTGIFPFGISTQSMPTRRKSGFTKFLVGKVTFSDSMCIRLEIFPWRVETDLFGLWMHVSLLKKSWLTLKNTFCQEIPYSNPKAWNENKPAFAEFPAEQTVHVSASSMDVLLSSWSHCSWSLYVHSSLFCLQKGKKSLPFISFVIQNDMSKITVNNNFVVISLHTNYSWFWDLHFRISWISDGMLGYSLCPDYL